MGKIVCFNLIIVVVVVDNQYLDEGNLQDVPNDFTSIFYINIRVLVCLGAIVPYLALLCQTSLENCCEPHQSKGRKVGNLQIEQGSALNKTLIDIHEDNP